MGVKEEICNEYTLIEIIGDSKNISELDLFKKSGLSRKNFDVCFNDLKYPDNLITQNSPIQLGSAGQEIYQGLKSEGIGEDYFLG